MPLKYRPIPELSESEIARFWSLVERKDPRECWPWIGRRHKRGYGCFDSKEIGMGLRATRVLLRIVNGKDPKHREACHSCDNPPCCNPLHVSAQTHLRNMRDARKRNRITVRRGPDHYLYGKSQAMPKMSFHPGRDLAGEKHPRSKLTVVDVIEIRRLKSESSITHAELARRFNVSHKLIVNIVHRRTWKHI